MEKTFIMGIWKFKDSIPLDELTTLAKEWAEDPKYLQLYIRRTSKDQNGLGFSYEIPPDSNSKEEMDKYFEEVSDKLKRKFGNGLVGWDISSWAEQIK